MSLETTRRGRPKGTGIDDRKFLSEVAALIAAKPDMKPTTAIKALGVTDPSAIRRLRDKFHQFSSECALSEPAVDHSGPAAGRSPTRSVAADVGGQRQVRREAPKTRSVPHVAHTATAEAVVDLAHNPDPAPPRRAENHSLSPALPDSIPTAVDLLALWYGMGITAMTTALTAQAAMTRSLVRIPHIDIALRQQIAWNEAAMSMVAMRGLSRTTLH